MATGYVIGGGVGGGIKTAQKIITRGYNPGAGASDVITKSDLGIPNGAQIISTVVHQGHATAGNDAVYGQAVGWQWFDDGLHVNTFNSRSDKVNPVWYVDIIYI